MGIVGWQAIAAGAVVVGAVLYLVWKLGVAPRHGARRKREAPDVPLERLKAKKPKKTPR